MNGIMFYLTRDVPLDPRAHDLHRLGMGADVDLAAAVLAAVQPARHGRRQRRRNPLGRHLRLGRRRASTRPRERSPRDCTREEVAAEVWDQLKAALNNGDEVLDDATASRWFLDPSIVYPNPTQATNLEPLLVNTAGSWDAPPDRGAARDREPLSRLGLRADLHGSRDDGGRQRGRAPRRQRDPGRDRIGRRPLPASGRCGTLAGCRSPDPARSTESPTDCPAGTDRRRRSPSATARSALNPVPRLRRLLPTSDDRL